MSLIMSADTWVDSHRVLILGVDGCAVLAALAIHTLRGSGNGMAEAVKYLNEHQEGRQGIDPENGTGDPRTLDPEMAQHVVGTVDDHPDWMKK